MGAVLAAQGDLDRATEQFRAAAVTGGNDAGIWLNLGLARYAAGDSIGAEEPMTRGVTLSGGYPEACALLGLAPDVEESREGTKRMSAEEARELLRAALRKVPRPVPGATNAARRAQKPKAWASRIAGSRSGEHMDLADVLYWKQ